MSRARILTIIVVVVVAGVAAGALLKPRKEPIRYREAEITRGPIESRVSATGTLNPVDQVEVGTQVSGIIQSIYVDYNDRVRPGQVLARIDPSLLRAQKSQAEANLEKARAAADEAERALRRSQELRAQGLLAEADLDVVQTTRRSRLADVRQAEAALELARVNLEHSTIISPIHGIVISRNVDVGQTVAASLQAPKLFQIARDLAEMQLEARVDEADIGSVREGQLVTFTVDSYPDESFEGRVLQIRAEPIVESGVVSYVVVVRVANPEAKLLPGMTANVTVVTARRENALLVSNAALRYQPRPERGEDRRGGGTASAAGTGAAMSRERAAARQPGRAAGGSPGGPVGRPEGGPPGGRAPAGTKRIWTLQPGRGPEPVPVRTGITDGTVTELVECPLPEGAKVVVGEIAPEERNAGGAANPLGGGMRPMGGPQRARGR